jgi:ketosteroid isomerase-like protein
MAGQLPSSELTKAGADHVRLAYHYIDRGDFDGYASVLHEDVQLHGLADHTAHGRSAAALLVRGQRHPQGHHTLYKLVADGDSVVAVGSYDGPAPVEFADVFTLADDGLLLSHRRFLAPGTKDTVTGDRTPGSRTAR